MGQWGSKTRQSCGPQLPGLARFSRGMTCEGDEGEGADVFIAAGEMGDIFLMGCRVLLPSLSQGTTRCARAPPK